MNAKLESLLVRLIDRFFPELSNLSPDSDCPVIMTDLERGRERTGGGRGARKDYGSSDIRTTSSAAVGRHASPGGARLLARRLASRCGCPWLAGRHS